MAQSQTGGTIPRNLGRRASSLLFALTFLAVPVAFAANEEAPSFVPGRVLVKFKPGVGKDKRSEVLAKHQARETGRIPRIDVRIIDLPKNADEHAQLAAFQARPEVALAELDQVFTLAMVPNDPRYTDPYYPEWHLPKIGAPAAWDITTGSTNLVIAVLDTGVYTAHPDLASKMVTGWNIYDNSSDTSDKTGHGTLVAGQAAAASNNGIGVASPAWGCRLMPIVVTDSYGWAIGSDLANGLVWAADHGARLVNMSFEMVHWATLTNAAKYVQDRGGVVIMSAGNSGVVNTSPDDPYILTVSATDQNDAVPSWSNTGSDIDLAAPGVSIMTTTRTGGYGSGTGTSASAPVVAGVAALMLSANPNLTGQQVQTILKQSADDLGTPGWDPKYGWGRVNAARAVAMAKTAGGQVADTLPPTVSFSSPAAGAVVADAVDIQVGASDNVGVVSVSLSVDGTLLANDSTAPYAFYWDSSKVSNGSHLLTATARDAAGNAASAQLSVTTDNPVPDTSPPTVSIISPTAGATVSGTITVQVSAGDNVGVADVTLKVDGTSLGTDSTAPYSFSWSTATVTGGPHTLTATAEDGAGNLVGTQTSVIVSNPVPDTTPPTVGIISPAAGATVSGTITVQVSASDNAGVSSVILYADGGSLGADNTAPYSFSWNTAAAANGAHTLTATARDAAGNMASAQVTVTVNNAPPPIGDTSAPTIVITSPAGGAAVSGTVSVTVSTSDNVGVARVELYVDGVLKATATAPPFTTKWNARKAAKGTHTLQCKAYDAAGNTAYSPVVTVSR
jgi:thermitase